MMKRVSVKLRPSMSGKAVSAIPRQVLHRTDKFDVVVAEIINPGHFYLQLGKKSYYCRCLPSLVPMTLGLTFAFYIDCICIGSEH